VLDLGNGTPQPLYSWERHLVPIVQEAWWALGPVWMGHESLASIFDKSKSKFMTFTVFD